MNWKTSTPHLKFKKEVFDELKLDLKKIKVSDNYVSENEAEVFLENLLFIEVSSINVFEGYYI